MKYIVYWVFLQMVPAECPQKAEFEKKFGKGYGCGVAHFKTNEIPDSAWYWNRGSAYQKYLDMVAEKEKSCIMVSVGTGADVPMYLAPPFTDIRFDSLPIQNH